MKSIDNNKILVLDMDGVINSNFLIRKWLNERNSELRKLRPNADENELQAIAVSDFKKIFPSDELVFPELSSIVSYIVQKTGCSIFWSSDWRLLRQYKNLENARSMFDRRGLPGKSLAGIIPPLGRIFLRGDEIREWLIDEEYNSLYDRVAVVDDIIEAGYGLPEGVPFFQTNAEYGITEEIAERIISFLNS